MRARLMLLGDERAIHGGCGSGRLIGDLMQRLPHGTLIAIDRSYLERLPSSELKEHLIDGVTMLAAQDDPPLRLAYWHLNMNAQKP